MVEGVIGKKKFSYDLWGGAVDIASMMESKGVPGTIQISRNTHELLTSNNKYKFIEREINLNEKDHAVTYLLNTF